MKYILLSLLCACSSDLAASVAGTVTPEQLEFQGSIPETPNISATAALLPAGWSLTEVSPMSVSFAASVVFTLTGDDGNGAPQTTRYAASCYFPLDVSDNDELVLEPGGPACPVQDPALGCYVEMQPTSITGSESSDGAITLNGFGTLQWTGTSCYGPNGTASFTFLGRRMQ